MVSIFIRMPIRNFVIVGPSFYCLQCISSVYRDAWHTVKYKPWEQETDVPGTVVSTLPSLVCLLLPSAPSNRHCFHHTFCWKLRHKWVKSLTSGHSAHPRWSWDLNSDRVVEGFMRLIINLPRLLARGANHGHGSSKALFPCFPFHRWRNGDYSSPGFFLRGYFSLTESMKKSFRSSLL